MCIAECFVLFHPLVCCMKPSSVLESNISLSTHVFPARLTKMGCVLFPDNGWEPGGPFLPDVPQFLQGLGAHGWRTRPGQTAGLHGERGFMTSGPWDGGRVGYPASEVLHSWLARPPLRSVLLAVCRPGARPCSHPGVPHGRLKPLRHP